MPAYRLSIAAGDAPPTEFRVFRAGVNTTTKGEFVFDEAAAKLVMAAYGQHGADVMIDLEHLSLAGESRHFDPDARGWCKLELRNGELWAVGVKWTPDGESRLSDKRQRYISPAFDIDKKSRRIVRVMNIAITAMPATDNLTPLVRARGGQRMAGNKLAAAMLAVAALSTDEQGDEMKAALTALKTLADGDEEGETPAPVPPPPPPADDKKEEETKATKTSGRPSTDDEELRKEMARLSELERVRSVREILSTTDKLTSPAFEKIALTRGPEDVRALLSALPVRPTITRELPSDRDAVKLSAHEERYCEINGVDSKEFLAKKVQLAQRDAQKAGK